MIPLHTQYITTQLDRNQCEREQMQFGQSFR
jgi:hypothetical protein